VKQSCGGENQWATVRGEGVFEKMGKTVNGKKWEKKKEASRRKGGKMKACTSHLLLLGEVQGRKMFQSLGRGLDKNANGKGRRTVEEMIGVRTKAKQVIERILKGPKKPCQR